MPLAFALPLSTAQMSSIVIATQPADPETRIAKLPKPAGATPDELAVVVWHNAALDRIIQAGQKAPLANAALRRPSSVSDPVLRITVDISISPAEKLRRLEALAPSLKLARDEESKARKRHNAGVRAKLAKRSKAKQKKQKRRAEGRRVGSPHERSRPESPDELPEQREARRLLEADEEDEGEEEEESEQESSTESEEEKKSPPARKRKAPVPKRKAPVATHSKKKKQRK